MQTQAQPSFSSLRPSRLILATTFLTGVLAATAVCTSRAQSGPGIQDRRQSAMEVVDLPDPVVSIVIEGDYRVITSNGLPDHTTGEFPNRYNPNAIRTRDHEYKIPLDPKVASRRTAARPEFGIALNGVVFDAGSGEFWTASGQRGRSAWNLDPASSNNQSRLGLDHNHAHVQPTGKYHYHGLPTGLIDKLGANAIHDGHAHAMVQIGWAFDGFPIYAPYGPQDPNDLASPLIELRSSYQLKSGSRPDSPQGPGGTYDGTYAADYEYVEGLGELDEANGRFGATPEFPEGTYYYVVTEAYPSVPRYWVGTPDSSISKRGRGGPGGQTRENSSSNGRGPHNGPPPPRN